MGALRKQTTDNKVDYKLAYSVCNVNIDRYWLGILRTTEYAALKYIINRTIRFDKVSEIILRNYISENIISKKGVWIQSGLNISARTYSSCIKKFRELGLISTEIVTTDRGRGNLVTVNLDNLMEVPMSHLKKPKKVQRGSCKSSTIGSCKSSTIEVTDNIEPTEINFLAPQEQISEAIRNTVKKSKEKKEKKSRENTFAGLQALWDTTYEEIFPGEKYTRLVGSDYSILLKNSKKQNDIPVRKVLRWSLENWHRLSQTTMSWAVMKNLMRDSPNPTVFAMLIRKFYQCYIEEKKHDTKIYIEPRPKVQELTKDQEEALAKAAERFKPNKDFALKSISTRDRPKKPKVVSLAHVSDEELYNYELPEWKDDE